MIMALSILIIAPPSECTITKIPNLDTPTSKQAPIPPSTPQVGYWRLEFGASLERIWILPPSGPSPRPSPHRIHRMGRGRDASHLGGRGSSPSPHPMGRGPG